MTFSANGPGQSRSAAGEQPVSAKIQCFEFIRSAVRLHRGLPKSSDAPLALTIGNFDGVHRGHQAMLSRLSEAADDLALASALLTFEPHPREFFAPESAPPRLSTLRDKLERFASDGVARVHVARFDASLASLSAEEFIDQVLVRKLRVSWILVGDDFRFGRDRAGDLALLWEKAADYSVEAMTTVTIDGERVSSSAVRSALAAGNLGHAAKLLGRPYAMSDRGAHCDTLGRHLGFPTANVVLRRKPALSGIFAVRVHGLGDEARAGVASLGVRPTVKQDAKPLLEVFVFDFDEAIYGRRITVEFLHKLRDEERYADLDRLTRQIRVDVAQARDYFATAK